MAPEMTEPPRTTGQDDQGRAVITLEFDLGRRQPDQVALRIVEDHPDIVLVKHYSNDPVDRRIVADLLIPSHYFEERRQLTLSLTDLTSPDGTEIWSESFSAMVSGNQNVIVRKKEL